MEELKNMTVEELEQRKAELRESVEAPEADLDAIESEGRAINEELENRKQAEAQKVEIRELIAAGEGEVVENIIPVVEERKLPTMEEIRNSREYIDAYAEYLKSGDDTEVRNMLTTENTANGTHSIPVPEFVYEITKTAWEREGIISRVRKSYLKGVIKVGFEISATGAVIHTEGGEAVSAEDLVIGTVEMIPQSIKKFVQISDEALDLRGEAFLRYLYDELTYRIAKKAADELIAKIKACGTQSVTTCPGVPKITEATIGVGTVAKAMAELSDEAANPVIMMNKKTWGALKAAQAAASYGYDPFEGLPVLFNNTIAAYSAATTGVCYMIVGDLDQGALINYPNGDGIEFKFDNLSLKKQDLVEVLGRQYAAIGVVAPDAFVQVVK